MIGAGTNASNDLGLRMCSAMVTYKRNL